MITAKTTSYADLLSRIQDLPPPARGRLRVYRGQTTEYPKIISSFGRVREGPPGKIFSTYFHH